jgi:hypothetical protein
MTVLQPASTALEPTNRPRERNLRTCRTPDLRWGSGGLSGGRCLHGLAVSAASAGAGRGLGGVVIDLTGSAFTGPLRLPGAEITGQAPCHGAQLNAADRDGNALVADGMKVGRGVLLDLGLPRLQRSGCSTRATARR